MVEKKISNNKRIFIFLVFTMFLPSIFAWFDYDWDYKQEITITTNSPTPQDYQMLLVLNNSNLGSNFNWSNSCEDILFVKDENILNYWIETCDTISEELFVWVKLEDSISASTSYSFDMFYSNNAAVSLSSPFHTFRQNEIHLATGEWRNAAPVNSQHINNNGNANSLRSTIGLGNFFLHGTSFVTLLSHGDNIHGPDDYYFSRYRFLFIPQTSGSYSFGTNSDDGSEIGMWNYDGLGGGLSTPISLSQTQTRVAHWYGGHGAGTCGSSGTRTTQSLTGGQGYWFDYVMNEWTGGQRAEMCINSGSGWQIVNEANFNNRIFAREYVVNAPTLTNVGTEESYTYLDVQILDPNPFANFYILQNQIFNLEVEVTCIGPQTQSCSNVNIFLREDNSNIPTSSSTPFWTSSSQPQTCNLNSGESCTRTFNVNATGMVGNFYELNLFASSSNIQVEDNFSNNLTLRIIDTNIVSFNQSVFNFLPFIKNSGVSSVNLQVVANIGDNDNVQVNCISGDCSSITTTFSNGINLLEFQTAPISFFCDDSTSGNYSAVYEVTSDFNIYGSQIQINCEVEPVFGPINIEFVNPLPLTISNVRQNNTINIEAELDCEGLCGDIEAYLLFEKSDWWNLSYLYRKEIELTTTVNAPNEYQVLIQLDEISAGVNFNWNNSCNDVRFVRNNILLSYFIEKCDVTNKEALIWIKTDSNFLAGNTYEFFMYYNSNQAVSLSNPFNTFIPNQIHRINGRYANTAPVNSQYIDNNIIANNLRSIIGVNPFTVDGQDYVSFINHGNNPFGLDDYYYSRYRFLFIPQISGTYTFGTSSDDGSEIIRWEGDGYGTGIRTPVSVITATQDIIAEWYGDHAMGTCGVSGNPGSRIINNGDVFWIDYIMNEWAGGQGAQMCINRGFGFQILDVSNFNNEIFARQYITPEPQVNIILEESQFLSTNPNDTPFYSISAQPQICSPIEDGNCIFNWIVNVTGDIGEIYNLSVLAKSSFNVIADSFGSIISINITNSILPEITLFTPINNSKVLAIQNIEFEFYLEDDDVNLTADLFINNIFVDSTICETFTNCSFNRSFLPGIYEWRVEVIDSDFNVVISEQRNLNVLNNYHASLTKSIINVGTNLNLINLSLNNYLNVSSEFKIIEFVESKFNFGSFSLFYDFIYNIISNRIGSVLRWDIVEENSFDFIYSITPNNESSELKNIYIIGFE